MENQPRFEYTAFWLFERRDTWRAQVHADWDAAVEEFAGVMDAPGEGVTVRGVYSSIGLRADVDMIIWVHAPKLEQLTALAVRIDQTAIGRALRRAQGYIGAAGMSQYDPDHGPAFLKGKSARRYMSVYPFIKTHEWYLLDYTERRRLMLEHGEMGREFPDILTNTVNSFGLQDQEFIVTLEDDDPNQIIKMVQKLRTAEVRQYTSLDTPIYSGERKATREVLADIRG